MFHVEHLHRPASDHEPARLGRAQPLARQLGKWGRQLQGLSRRAKPEDSPGWRQAGSNHPPEHLVGPHRSKEIRSIRPQSSDRSTSCSNRSFSTVTCSSPPVRTASRRNAAFLALDSTIVKRTHVRISFNGIAGEPPPVPRSSQCLVVKPNMSAGQNRLDDQPIDRVIRGLIELEGGQIDPAVPFGETLEISGELRDLLRGRGRGRAKQPFVDVFGKRARHRADGGTGARGLSAGDGRCVQRRWTLVLRSPGEGGPARDVSRDNGDGGRRDAGNARRLADRVGPHRVSRSTTSRDSPGIPRTRTPRGIARASSDCVFARVASSRFR